MLFYTQHQLRANTLQTDKFQGRKSCIIIMRGGVAWQPPSPPNYWTTRQRKNITYLLIIKESDIYQYISYCLTHHFAAKKDPNPQNQEISRVGAGLFGGETKIKNRNITHSTHNLSLQMNIQNYLCPFFKEFV